MKDIKALPTLLSNKISICRRGKSSLEKEVILRASLVQVPKIHAHSYLSIFHGYGYNIGYPLGLVYGFDEPYLQLLGDHFFDL